MKHLAIILVLLFSASSSAQNEEAWDKLNWDFSAFAEKFEQKNWSELNPYITDETKVGFGGEIGIKGVRQIYADDERCYTAMVFALKQGCKKLAVGDNLSCSAPPQWNDPSIIYLGARAEFVYKKDKQRWVVSYLICGGD